MTDCDSGLILGELKALEGNPLVPFRAAGHGGDVDSETSSRDMTRLPVRLLSEKAATLPWAIAPFDQLYFQVSAPRAFFLTSSV